MNTHKPESVVFLATLLDTSPAILLACDPETAEGMRVRRQLEVCDRFVEAMIGRGRYESMTAPPTSAGARDCG